MTYYAMHASGSCLAEVHISRHSQTVSQLAATVASVCAKMSTPEMFHTVLSIHPDDLGGHTATLLCIPPNIVHTILSNIPPDVTHIRVVVDAETPDHHVSLKKHRDESTLPAGAKFAVSALKEMLDAYCTENDA